MTLDEFVGLDRLPTGGEVMELCLELGIKTAMNPEGPVLRVNEANRAEGLLLAKLIRREPWRSQILQRLPSRHQESAAKEKPGEVIECLWPGTGLVGEHWFPESGWPAGAKFWRKKGETEWRPIEGREWKGTPSCATTSK